MSMLTVRIINFTAQSLYLMVTLFLWVKIAGKAGASPVTRWFLWLAGAQWLWVSGRFAESVIYLFLPDNNGAYVFAANYQYIGLTFYAAFYTIWSLYLAGFDRLAENKLIRILAFACPVVVNTVVFTNPLHHLMYTKLVMGERVGHGAWFMPLAFWAYTQMFIAYLVSVVKLLITRDHRWRNFFLYTVFSALPVGTALYRAFSGVDIIDYTPYVTGIACFCMYLLAFRYSAIRILPASLEHAVRNAPGPLGIYDEIRGEFVYLNGEAETRYGKVFGALPGALPVAEGTFPLTVEGFDLQVTFRPLGEGRWMTEAVDVTEINRRLHLLEEQIHRQEELDRELADENRNIEAYVTSLKGIDSPEKRETLAEKIQEEALRDVSRKCRPKN